MKIFFSFIIFVCSIFCFSGQVSYNFSGQILDLHDNSPIESAQIYINNIKMTTTKMNGQFQIKLDKGNYQLLIKHLDCNDITKKISINDDVFMRFHLEHHIKNIEEVLLHRSHSDKNSSVQTQISKSYIDNNSTENLANLLSKSSGISALKTGNQISKPVIHGMYSSRIGIFNNGVKLAEQEWGVEHAPNLDTNSLDHIDIIKGAGALKYGNVFTGGVILAENKIYNKKDTLFGKINTAFQSNGRAFSTQLGLNKSYKNQWAFQINTGTKISGDLSTPNYLLMNTASQNYNFSFNLANKNHERGVALDYYFTKNVLGIYRGSHIGNLSDFTNSLNQNVPLYFRDFSYQIQQPNQQISHHLMKFSAYKTLPKIGKLSVDYSFQYNNRKEFDIFRGVLKNQASVDLQLITQNLNLNHYIERKNWNLENGIQTQIQNNRTDADNKTRKLIPNYVQMNLGLFSVYKYKIFNKIWAEVSARADANSFDVLKFYDLSEWENLYQFNYQKFEISTIGSRIKTNPKLIFNNISFNLGVNWEYNKTNYLKINYVNNSRTPNIAELFADGLHHSASIIEKGTLNLKNETANQINIEWQQNLPIFMEAKLNLNPYIYYSESFINQVPIGVQNTIRGIFPIWQFQQIKAKMLGLDIDFTTKFNSNFSYNSQISLLKADDLSNHQPLIMMMPTRLIHSLSYINPKFRNFSLNFEHQFTAHQKNVPVHNLFIEEVVNDELQITKIDLDTAPPSYHLFSLNAGFQINKFFKFGLNVSNLFNKNYKDYLNRMRFFASEMGRNIQINLNYQF